MNPALRATLVPRPHDTHPRKDTHVNRPTWRLLVGSVGAALAVLTASGCADSTARTGAAAVIGSSRISTAELANTVTTALANPAASALAGDPAAFQHSVLNRLIDNRLTDAAAQRLGVSVTPGQIDEQYAQIEQQVQGADQLPAAAAKAGLTLSDVRALARNTAQKVVLGDKLTQSLAVPESTLQQAYNANIGQYDQVRTAQILLPTLAAAQALLPQAAALDSAGFGELAKAQSTDASTKDQGGDLGLAPLSAYDQAQLGDYGKAAFAAKVGDTFAVQSPRGGHVVRVLAHQTVTLAQAAPALRRTVLKPQSDAAVQKVLQDTAKDLHVTVNPRFGSWDSTSLKVGDRDLQPSHVLSTPGPGDLTAGAPVPPTAP